MMDVHGPGVILMLSSGLKRLSEALYHAFSNVLVFLSSTLFDFFVCNFVALLVLWVMVN